MGFSKQLEVAALMMLCVGLAVNSRSTAESSSTLNRTLHNPTAQELMAFLINDRVHSIRYDTNGTYTCFMFSRDFKEEANAAGLECALTYVIYYEKADGTSGHFVDAFNVSNWNSASDLGLTFVEPQSATVIVLNVGAVYLNRTIVDLSVVW